MPRYGHLGEKFQVVLELGSEGYLVCTMYSLQTCVKP